MDINIWKDLAGNASELIFICNSENSINYANDVACKCLEYTNEELIGLRLDELFLEKAFDLKDKLQECIASPVKWIGSIYRKNKTCFQVSVKLIHVKDSDSYILYASDETELLRAQKEVEFIGERAKEAGKVRDEFVANVTHELRTPVNGIKGHTQYLMTTELDREQNKELKIIYECCINMEKLINNILDFSKLESGKFNISNHEFVFDDFLQYITETNGKLIEDRGLKFIVNKDPSIPEKLFGDDFRMTQVVNNLLSNAMKFTSKGYIAMEITRSMQYGRDIELFFMVMDTGIGIPADKKDKLFESFTQVDASISRTYGGTGLGLAICKQLVELMGGKISLDSEYGKGSSFSFTVRMKIPEDVEISEDVEIKPAVRSLQIKSAAQTLYEEVDRINKYGTEENTIEIDRNLEKLSLCIELENYEKAEQFAENIKALVTEGPENLKPLAFKTIMMIRKENLEGTRKFFEELQEAINITRA